MKLYSTFILSFTLALVSCNESGAGRSHSLTENIPKTYVMNCYSCHGPKGDAKIGGAKDLTLSTLDKTTVSGLIENGKGAMPGFKGILTPNQVNEVMEFVITLRK